MELTNRLAKFAAALTYDDVPDEIRARARLFVLDGIAVMLGAVGFSRQDGDRCLERYLERAAPPGPASVVGMGRTTMPMMAAFANGTLSEVLDCQDTQIPARIHNGSAVIPAALAADEVGHASGRDLVVAVIVGYEVGCRLGLAVQPRHWYSGFQITGTFNTCAAAATVGRLMGFGTEEMAAALGIGGFILPVSHGDNIFKGHSVKPIHGGQPAACGVSAADLARAGYRSGPLEGEPPRFHAPLRILGEPNPDLAKALEGMGEVWHSLEVGFKPFPVGLFINGPVEACLSLLKEEPVSAADIDKIDIATYHDGRKFTGEKYTTIESNFVDAHLSMPYCVAVTLTDGEMTPRQLLRSRLRDPAVHRLAARVKVVEDEEFNRRYPHDWPLRLDIRLKDGRRRVKSLDQVKWSPRRPPPWDEAAGKFVAFAEPVIGRAAAERAIEFVAGLERAKDVAPLLDIVRG